VAERGCVGEQDVGVRGDLLPLLQQLLTPRQVESQRVVGRLPRGSVDLRTNQNACSSALNQIVCYNGAGN
jgi:hypothetical protein